MIKPLEILAQHWQYNAFRPQQLGIIDHVLEGKDTLGILPTGGGKSICYQVPALILEGACLVISPLIALMKDQAEGLEKRGIKTLMVHSGMDADQVRRVYEKMSTGDYKFIFVSPERLKSVLFLDFLTDWKISLLAVDEAHCISQWGYDFRPAYLDISLVREYFPSTPVIALTASATPLVQEDIIEKLGFKGGQTFFSTFARPNLSFSCFEVENKITRMVDILQKVKGSCLVYCRNRRRTAELAEVLKAAGLSADHYHAGLDQELRNMKQESWINHETSIMVCTNAFGMGIDKADVRCVIHVDIPDTPEAYYQEAGRAGRDGERAYAVLLYQQKDLRTLDEGIFLKYPAIDTIRNVYEALAYYFEVGIGHGLETMCEFEVVDFCKKFEFNVTEVLSSIKLLEQQGYWTLSDSIFNPSRISVSCSKEDIENLEKQQPELDEILKHVLRMYSGIWYNAVPVREFAIAQNARVGKDYVQMILRKLQARGIIDYEEATDKPRLFYLHDRLPKDRLHLDMALITMLRERYEERVAFMIDLASQVDMCRARKLTGFFMEEIADCGICDICLARKQALRKKENFELVRNNILTGIELSGSINIDLFCWQYSSLLQESVMDLIRFMLDEGTLELNTSGDLIRKK